MEATVIPVLLSAAGKLFTELTNIFNLKKHNATVVRDIEEFRQSLETDLQLLETKRKSLQDDQAWAIDSLSKDLEDASLYLENCRAQGIIQCYWDAKRTSSELTALRQKLSHNFQTKLFFTSLELHIDKEKRTEDFHSKLVELLTRSAAHSTNEIKGLLTNEIKGLLKPLTMGLKGQGARFQQLRAEIRELSAPLNNENDSSLDTEKFLQDILAGLAESVSFSNASEDDILCYDPFTDELMFDPVKCGDGKTYDRFSVLKYNLESTSHNKPLVILCPDESVRIHVFDKFQHEQPDRKMRSRRNEYKTEALAIADAGEFGEALVRLDNVLQWDPDDLECLHKRDKMRDFYRQEALKLAGKGNRKEALDMLERAHKWFPLDREIFDKLEMMTREKSTTSNSSSQQQSHTLKGISPELHPTLVAPAPMGPMDEQPGRNGKTSNKKEGKVQITDGDNSRPNHASKTVQWSTTAPVVQYDQPKISPVFQNDGSNIPRGDQASKVTESPLWWEENFGWSRYFACLTCQCKPCGCSEVFARDLTDSAIIEQNTGMTCACCLPAISLCCLDFGLSICSCYWCCNPDNLIIDGWLQKKYGKQSNSYLDQQKIEDTNHNSYILV